MKPALVAAVVAVLLVPTPAHAHYDHNSRWKRLASCESTHRWHIRDGGIQIIGSTWAAYGGRNFAYAAEGASRRQQIRVGKRIAWRGWRDAAPQGPGAWPTCWEMTR